MLRFVNGRSVDYTSYQIVSYHRVVTFPIFNLVEDSQNFFLDEVLVHQNGVRRTDFHDSISSTIPSREQIEKIYRYRGSMQHSSFEFTISNNTSIFVVYRVLAYLHIHSQRILVLFCGCTAYHSALHLPSLFYKGLL